MTLHLLDANVLIRAHEDYYPIDRIPQFWAWLLETAEATAIKMPIQIYNEVAPSRGMLAEWPRRPNVKESLVLAEPTDLTRVQRVLADSYAADLTDVEIEEIGVGSLSARRCPRWTRPHRRDQGDVEAERPKSEPENSRRLCNLRSCHDHRFRAVPETQFH